MTHRFKINKMVWSRLVALIMAMGAFMLFAPRSFAEESQVEAQQRVVDSEIDFASIGIERDQVLEGPFDAEQIFFSLPENWVPTSGAELRLDIDIFALYVGDSPNFSSLDERFLTGTLEVELNGILLEIIQLEQVGQRSINIPISQEAMDAVNEERRYRLEITLNSGDDCSLNLDTTVMVKPTSQLTIPHAFGQPPTDLTLLPRPIYQRSFLPDAAVFIVPESPTAAELQAAYTVISGFGSMTNGNLIISLASENNIPEEALPTSHLVYVGKRDRFPSLEAAELPIPMNEDGFQAAGAREGDGLIQMALSPFNTNGVVLVVTGADDASVVKAGQAVSTGNVQVSRRRSIAVVADVQPRALLRTASAVDQTFSILGYGTQSLEGVGEDSVNFRFYVPPGQVPDGDAYLDLSFVHAATVDPAQSSLSVQLNDDAIGGIPLSENTSTLSTARIVIPPRAVQPGTNDLEIEGRLFPFVECTGENQDNVWLDVRPESILHLPLRPAQPLELPPLSLEAYPDPFIYDPILGNTAVVVPSDDPLAWQVAAQLVFQMGDDSDLTVSNLVVAFADDVPVEVRQERDLLIVGQASNVVFIDEINERLPVPFQPGTDNVAEAKLPVTYRLPANASLGYLQLLPAPWNDDRTILAVLGRTDEGIQEAALALLEGELRNQLSGNFAAVAGTQVTAFDTRSDLDVAQPAEIVPPPVTTEAEATVASPNDWVGTALTATISLIGVIVLVVIGSAGWQRYGRDWWAQRRDADQKGEE